MSGISDKLKFLEQIKPFVADDEMYGRWHANLHDLVESGEWLLAELDQRHAQPLTRETIEDFLVGLDVRYIEHVMHHIRLLRKDIKTMLARFDDPQQQIEAGSQ
jgi:hypothetical protein